MRRWTTPFAAVMVALYVVLAVGATTCLVNPSEEPAPLHHHSQSHVAHSAFCAWACQANPTVALVSGAPSVSLAAVLSPSNLYVPEVIEQNRATASPSRAPPLFT